jgi:HTH-type transcriptional regulator/antitoxin HigA
MQSYPYPMGESTSVGTMESLMHEFEVEPVFLVKIIGSVDIVREVIQGQQRISKVQAKSLTKFLII